MNHCLSPLSLLRFFAHGDLEFLCKVTLGSQDRPYDFWLPGYFPLFALTVIFEMPIYVSYLRWRGEGFRRSLDFVVFANLLTHPLVTYGFPNLALRMEWNLAQSTLAKEIFAPLAEALLLKWMTKLNWLEAALLALLANLFSWWLGTAFFA